MNTNLEIFYNVAGIVLWLTAFPALWISGRVIRRSLIHVDRSTQLFLWLVLGGFFRIPLVDLLSAVLNFIAQTLPSDQNMGNAVSGVGITDFLLTLLIYALGFYFALRIIRQEDPPLLKQWTLRSWEQGWIALGMAGLLYYLIGDLVRNFIVMTFF